MSRIEKKFYGCQNLQDGELSFSKMFNRSLPCNIVTDDEKLRAHAVKHGIESLTLDEALGVSTQEESKEAS